MDAHIDTRRGEAEAGRPTRLGCCFDQLHGLAEARIFTHMARFMRSGEVSFSQINVLFRLYGQGPQRIADLARGASLSHCAMSRLVGRLVEEGLAQKQQNSENRRERLVSLTPAGGRFLDELRRNTAAAYESLFTAVPPGLVGRLLAVLEDILPHLPTPEHQLPPHPRP